MPQITAQTLRVLGAFAVCPTDGISGAEIARTTKIKSGTLYPILFRLEKENWLESKWEVGEPHLLGRPRRRLYELTALGEKSMHAVYREVSTIIGGPAWEQS
jgi:DNA-binding PadR family transcriptional regulator